MEKRWLPRKKKNWKKKQTKIPIENKYIYVEIGNRINRNKPNFTIWKKKKFFNSFAYVIRRGVC